MDNPLTQQAPLEADQQRIAMKAAAARNAGDWFDIFDEVVTSYTVKTMESHGDSAVDVINDWKDDRLAVRREFVAHEIPLSEDIEVEGPEPDPSRPTDPTALLWPRGYQATFIWPDNSKLSFRGRKALIAFAFVRWWAEFQNTFKVNPVPNAGQTRIVAPGSPEWNEYYRAKAIDRKRGE